MKTWTSIIKSDILNILLKYAQQIDIVNRLKMEK